jgi:hypothetical protein
MRLGHRQLALLRATAAGKASTHHTGQGRMVALGGGEWFPDRVLERLLDLELVELGADQVAGHQLQLTDAGRAELEARA